MLPSVRLRYRAALSRHPPSLPPLYTPVAAQRPRSFSSRPIVLSSRFSRADSGQGPAEIPRETLPRGEGGVRFESGENKRGFPVALRPNFKLSPLSGGGGGRGGQGGRDGTKVSVCIKPRERQEAVGERAAEAFAMRAARPVLLRALPRAEPRLKFNSNSPAFCGSAFPRPRNPALFNFRRSSPCLAILSLPAKDPPPINSRDEFEPRISMPRSRISLAIFVISTHSTRKRRNECFRFPRPFRFVPPLHPVRWKRFSTSSELPPRFEKG